MFIFGILRKYLIIAGVLGAVGFGLWKYYTYTQETIRVYAENAARAEMAQAETQAALEQTIKDLEKVQEKIQSANIMEDVSYSAKDTKGNEYFLKASEGTIDQNDSNFIFLTSVKGIIKLKLISLRKYFKLGFILKGLKTFKKVTKSL